MNIVNLFLFSIFVCPSECWCDIDTYKDDVILNDIQMSYAKNLLKFYQNYTFVLHIENHSVDVGNILLEYINKQLASSSLVFNYDTSTSAVARPSGVQFINLVIFKDPWKFAGYLNNELNVNLYDTVLFILYAKETLMETYEKPFWTMFYLDLSRNVLIVDMIHNTETTVYKTCYFCGEHTNILDHLQTTNTTLVEIVATNLLPAKINNLRGHFFRVGYIDYFPYIFCKNTEHSIEDDEIIKICRESGGMESRALDELSKRLNFSFRLINFGKSSQASYSHLVEKLLERRVDFVLGGITITPQRSINATFTKSIVTDEYRLLYRFSFSKASQILSLIYPFRMEVWITIIIFLIFSSLFVFLTENVKVISSGTRLSYADSFIICTRSILEQTITISPAFVNRRKSFYIFLTAWWLCSINIDTAYKSKLASIFVRPPHHEPNDIVELMAAGYDIVYDSLRLQTIGEILEIYKPVAANAQRQLVAQEGLCNTYLYALKNKVAMLGEYSTLQYNTQFVCGDVNSQHFNQLRIATNAIRSTPHAWLLQKGVPYWKPFNRVFSYLDNGGFFAKWKRESIEEFTNHIYIAFSKDNSKIEYEDRVTLESYMSAFIIYILGNLLAIIAMLGEIIKEKYYMP